MDTWSLRCVVKLTCTSKLLKGRGRIDIIRSKIIGTTLSRRDRVTDDKDKPGLRRLQ
jgi:hypothetical protein